MDWLSKNEIDWNVGLRFRLKKLESEERFQIWDNLMKKFQSGEWNLQANDGNMIPVSKVQYYSQENMKTAFADSQGKVPYTKKYSYTREIIVNGQEKKFGFPKSAENQFTNLFNLLKGQSIDPLVQEYVLTKEGIGIKTRYTLQFATPNQQVQPVAQPQTAPQQPIQLPQTAVQPAQPVQLPTPQPAVQFNETEQAIIAALKGVPVETRTAEYIKQTCTDNKITEDARIQLVITEVNK